MSDGKPDFSQKIGPLPLGAWVAIAGGGIGLYMLHRNKAAAAAAPASIDPTASIVGTGGAGAVSESYVPTTGGVTTTTPAKLTSNTQWGSQAFSWLAALGMNPTMADSAIRNYLDGRTLSVQENALISQVLGKYGTPPEQLPAAPPVPVVTPISPPPAPPAPAPVVQAPPQPVGIAPPRVNTYTVQRGDTLSGIAARYPDPAITWQSIFNANRGTINNPHLIYPGQVITIA